MAQSPTQIDFSLRNYDGSKDGPPKHLYMQLVSFHVSPYVFIRPGLLLIAFGFDCL